MHTKFFLILGLLTIVLSAAHADLYSRFKNPPREYSPVPFWFLNGNLDADELRWQVEQMAGQHVYGAFMHARTGLATPYFSEEWWSAISAAVDTASKHIAPVISNAERNLLFTP